MYLIDGNNVIGRRAKGYEDWFHDKPGARRQFLKDLARLAKVKKLRLTVVFDGAPDQSFPDGASYRGVKVFYARQGSDADTRITEMVEAEHNRKNLIVVTSDRKLTDRVRVCGVQVMRAGEFQILLDEASASVYSSGSSGNPTASSLKEEEEEDWMRYFGVDEDDE
jgi:predicted RNA-binding protein with PIN domain